jgi:hypothetical protein
MYCCNCGTHSHIVDEKPEDKDPTDESTWEATEDEDEDEDEDEEN